MPWKARYFDISIIADDDDADDDADECSSGAATTMWQRVEEDLKMAE